MSTLENRKQFLQDLFYYEYNNKQYKEILLKDINLKKAYFDYIFSFTNKNHAGAGFVLNEKAYIFLDQKGDGLPFLIEVSKENLEKNINNLDKVLVGVNVFINNSNNPKNKKNLGIINFTYELDESLKFLNFLWVQENQKYEAMISLSNENLAKILINEENIKLKKENKNVKLNKKVVL